MSGDEGRLAIPLSELEGFGGRLRSIKSRMNATKKMFDSYAEDIGDDGVVDKMESFESNWEDGRGDIDEQLTGLADMADTVYREATKVDQDLAKQLEKGTKDS
ncbi:hypothetical protein [Streptomyces purpurogeneiscleroticus]|uniref:hypothetical protein n=1 Tax=Streptomyces purpurogeneiscleroticus TaxID=68259 RepID=UPI001CC06523|nr:hypothetical protein [Streptomyces purpurogeneiscleroticus]MBZ4016021.1 hypothetical protein [Streptomyces purpurogeneiscleroticus]